MKEVHINIQETNSSITGCPFFDIKKWYMVVKSALDVEQEKLNEKKIRYGVQRLYSCVFA